MAKAKVKNDVLSLDGAGVYDIEFLPSGHAKVRLDDGAATVIKNFSSVTSLNLSAGATLNISVDQIAQFTTITGAGAINLSGLAFNEAGPGGLFEPSVNLDALLTSSLLFGTGAGWEDRMSLVIDRLSVDGDKAGAIQLVWDFLDELYVNAGYYAADINEAFVRLGVEYVEYLEAGGQPFTGVTAKYTADNGDADSIPQRAQSLHDNLLGNLNGGVIAGRFNGELEAELLALVPAEYKARAVFEGNQNQLGTQRHDDVRAFDYDKGWDRPDYFDVTYSGVVDAAARNGSNMHYGAGNPADDWTIVRNEGAGVELALKVKHRGGDEYPEAFIDADGVAHYQVLTGAQAGQPNRAEWNFDYAATVLAAGQDDAFIFKLEVDVDPTDGEQFVEASMTVYGGQQQGSSNYGFAAIAGLIDTDPAADGVQPYTLGEAEFAIRLSAYDADTLELVGVNQVVVHVG